MVIDYVFVGLVLGVAWNCGRLVGRRTDEARRSVALVEELAAVDPAELAGQVIAEERSRLAGEALAVVRRAVAAMEDAAEAAERDGGLDARALVAVQDEGRTAVTDLRRLLGLLRTGDAPELAVVAAATGPRVPPVYRADIRVALGLAVLFLLEYGVLRVGPSRAEEIALTLLLVGALALRRASPMLACVVATAPWLLAIALDTLPITGFASLIALGLLAWSAAGEGSRRSLAALAGLAAATIAVAGSDEPRNVPALAALFALPGIAGYVRGARERDRDSAEATAADLMAEQNAATERAARGERLRLARELHDVASHAVGVMVLQAGAALALRERDPDAALAAVRMLRRAGREAMAELDGLFGVLDAGAVGPPGLAAPAPEVALEPALEALAERVRVASLDVTLDIADGVAPRGDVAAVILRVVQEALTNALRHAPGSAVVVTVDEADGGLVVEVRDDGTGAEAHERGFGLVGLEERVRALGGDFTAGPEGTGFAVSARLPREAAEPSGVTA
jgi:signal transduction histidine kinase